MNILGDFMPPMTKFSTVTRDVISEKVYAVRNLTILSSSTDKKNRITNVRHNEHQNQI